MLVIDVIQRLLEGIDQRPVFGINIKIDFAHMGAELAECIALPVRTDGLTCTLQIKLDCLRAMFLIKSLSALFCCGLQIETFLFESEIASYECRCDG